MSAIFRAYNDWLAEFCRTDPARLKGIATINLDDVEDGIKELELAARLGLSGAMITEYPLEHRRYDGSEYEPFWAAAAALDLPLSLHTATRRQGRIRGAGDQTLRDASSRATKAFYPALSMCDLIFSGRLRASSPPDPRHRGVRAGMGRPTCSPRWTTPTASATARRFTGSRACPREGGGPALAKAGTACCRATSSAATSS